MCEYEKNGDILCFEINWIYIYGIYIRDIFHELFTILQGLEFNILLTQGTFKYLCLEFLKRSTILKMSMNIVIKT